MIEEYKNYVWNKILAKCSQPFGGISISNGLYFQRLWDIIVVQCQCLAEDFLYKITIHFCLLKLSVGFSCEFFEACKIKSLFKIRISHVREMFNCWARRRVEIAGSSATLSWTTAMYSRERSMHRYFHISYRPRAEIFAQFFRLLIHFGDYTDQKITKLTKCILLILDLNAFP